MGALLFAARVLPSCNILVYKLWVAFTVTVCLPLPVIGLECPKENAMSEVSEFIPMAPLHWTSILHYILLLGALFMLMASGDDAPIIYLIVLAIMGILLGVDLYLNLFHLGQVVIFVVRVCIFAIPALIGGLGPTEETRAAGIGLAAFAGLPLLAVTILTCILGNLGDPRISYWCK
jgi:hypothetical protein